MIENPLNWSGAAQALDAARTILVVTHVGPDGDAIGSLLGLTNALRARGKTVDAAVDDGSPEVFRFLPGAETIREKLTAGQWDVMVSVDASDEQRAGKVGEYGRANSAQVINLDHHATNTLFGSIHLVMPEAVSATEIVYRLLLHIGQSITPDVAKPLLTGLVTDTIGFRISTVTADTLDIARQLMLAGASLSEISMRALDSKSFSALLLWRGALQSVTLQDKIIAATVTKADRQQAGLDDVTDGGLVSLLNTVSEAMVAVVFKETDEESVELSFRSKPGYDVAGVALSLGGGGHKQASGATVKGTLDDVRARVVPMLREVVKQGKLVIV